MCDKYPNRPTCLTPGCEKPAHNTASAANPVWRKYCGTCHNERRKNFQNLSANLKKSTPNLLR